MDLWWKCSNCKKKINFTDQMSLVFDEDGESDFDPKKGLMFHTIICDCGNQWTISISEPDKYDIHF
jgi:hypothetical protein